MSPKSPRVALATIAAACASTLPSVLLALPAPAVSGSDPIMTMAGSGATGYRGGAFAGDGGSATSARLSGGNGGAGVGADAAGNIYVTDAGNRRVRKIDSSGVITTVAGNGTPGIAGDGGPALQAQFYNLTDVEADLSGHIYLSDYSNPRIRRVDAASGIIDTVAGGGTGGDGGPAKGAALGVIYAVTLDSGGNLYLSETSSHRVRKVTAGADGMVDGDADEIITTVAGAQQFDPLGRNVTTGGYSGDGGQATEARLNRPVGVVVDEPGNLFIADSGNGRVRRVDPSGIISTVAGNGTIGFSGDGGPATAAKIATVHIDLDDRGQLYLSGDYRVRQVTPGPDGVVDGDDDDVISTVAGTGTSTFAGDWGPASQASFLSTSGVSVDPAGDLYIADPGSNRVRRVGPDGPLHLTMTDSPDPVGLTGEVSYTLTVTNFSAGAATGVALSDILPAGTTYVSATPDQGTCTHAGATVECSLGEIRADATSTVVVKVRAPAEPTTLTNRATVSSAEADPYLRDNIAVEQTAVVGPNLGVNVVDAPDPVAVGGELTYTATVSNAGPGDASGISFSDTFPAGTTFVSAEPSQGACSEAGGTVTCELGAVAAGAGAEVRIKVVAPSEPATLTNTATAGAVEPDPAPANNTHTAQTAVMAPVNLSLSTTDTPDPALAGRPLEYALTVTNNGTVPATGVVVTDTLPAGVTYTYAAPGCTRAGQVVTCSLGTLAPGATAGASITASPTRSDLLSNTATVRSAQPEASPVDNTDVERTVVSTTGTPAGLGLATVDRPDPVAVGSPLTYDLTVTNAAPVPATGVVLSDPLPAGVSFQSATVEQGSCSETGGTITCTVGTLASGAHVGATIVVVPTVAGNLEITATVSSAEVPGATSTATTLVAAAPCGQVITEDTVLKADVGPCESVGIVVGADGITLDLGGHRIFGTPGPSNKSLNGDILGNQPGIYLPGRSNVTVKNGTVTDFDAGVFLRGGRANTITGLVIRDNIGPANNNNAELGDGIALFDSAENRIVANTLVNNGVYDGIGVLGGGSDGNLLQDNIVEDTFSVPEKDTIWNAGMYNHGQGIMINASSIGNPSGQTIDNTRVLGNVIRRSAAAGISNINNIGGVIYANTIENNGGVNGPANGIGVQTGPGWSGGSINMLVQSNEIHGNHANGIYLAITGAKVLNNDVADNNASNGGFNDLHAKDDPSCVKNTWAGNTWGTGGYSPDCASAPDTTGPDTTITGGPNGPTTDDTPSFEFSSPEPASTFACRADAEAFAPCTSPHTTAALPAGAHSFEVQSIDPEGNVDPTPAIRSFTVGTTAAAVSAIADFNGDGSSDISVFRAGSGSWFPQGGAADAWGTEGDIAVPADYDGIAGSEMAVFRPSTGTWFVKGGDTTAWGTEGDLPVPADYDGDKKADVAVFRPTSGAWYIRPSGGGADQSVGWGTTGDIPVPGDYNGDGTTEIAVFRPSSGTWFVLGGPTIAWGTDGDIPVPGDYDANGSTDMAVFRPSTGTWFVEGGATIAWGTEGDIPVPGDFDGNASADIAVFRPSAGAWFVNGGPTTNWGTAGDQPLPLPPAIRHSLAT